MTDSLLKFPCEFPLKVMGLSGDEFRSVVLGIVHRHVDAKKISGIEERPSRDGKYLGLTFTFLADSKTQVDALYAELTSCKNVLVVL